MEMICQLHSSAALPAGKQPTVTTVEGDRVDSRADADITEKRKCVAPIGNRTPFPRWSRTITNFCIACAIMALYTSTM
jgi:hypothetical protein